MHDELEITLFGSPEVRFHGLLVTGFRSSKAQALLYYLAVSGRPHTRFTLAGLLWGDQSDTAARASLSKCLSNLHDLVGNAVLIERQTVAFNRNCPYQLDTELFAAGVNTPPTPETIQPLQAALALYRGDFLEGFYVREAPDFEQWLLVQRAHYREAVVQGFYALAMLAEQQGDLPQAIAHSRRLLALEPWHEEVHRQLMVLLARSGQRAAALAQFETCRRVLEQELAVEPDAETLRVVNAIRAGMFDKLTRWQGDKVNGVRDHPISLPPPHLVMNNLPVPPTPLIGREREMAEVRDLLRSNRLVVLTGIGGAGKTRLALATASAMAQTTFFDVTCWVDFTSIANAALIPQTIATALGLFEQTEQPIERTLINYLQERRLLLLLDRCEHLVEACAQVCHHLLQNCSRLHIFATSRELLHLVDEVVYQVPPLSLPEPQLRLPTAEVLVSFAAGFDAVKLFVARAITIPGDFQLSSQNAATVLQLCQRLDGIPLALELAATRLNILSLPQILERLDRRLQLLRQTLYGVSPQQQSLVASLDWSYELLSDKERILLRRLAIFVREFSLEAVEAVCTDEALLASEVMDTLAHLADKSLVVVERVNHPHPSFRLLDTIQAYALEKCEVHGEVLRLRHAHLAFFLQLAQMAAPHLRDAVQPFWFSQLAYAYDNLRAALEFAITEDLESTLQLVGALGWFWYMRGYFSEGRHWLETVLAVDLEATHQSELTLDQAKRRGAVLYYAAILAYLQSDYVTMQERIEKGLRLCLQCEDEHGIANLQCVLVFSKLTQGEYILAAQLVQECISIYRACQDRWGLAFALHTWGFMLWQQAKPEQARPVLEESAHLFKLLGDRVGGVFPLAMLGSLAVQQGHQAKGEAILAECLSFVKTLGDTLATDWVMAEYAHLACAQGDYNRAEQLYRTGLVAARGKGHQYGVTEMLRFLGLLAIVQGEYAKARPLLLEALVLCQRGGDKRSVVHCLSALAALPDQTQNRIFAVHLLSTVSAQITTHEIGLAPIDRTLFEQTSTELPRQVHADRFNLAWAEGQTMSLDEAVTYALANPKKFA